MGFDHVLNIRGCHGLDCLVGKKEEELHARNVTQHSLVQIKALSASERVSFFIFLIAL